MTCHPQPSSSSFSIRPLGDDDLNWVLVANLGAYRHRNWGPDFDLLVVRVIDQWRTDGAGSAGWFAEAEPYPAGSVLYFDEGDGVGRLSLLYVAPARRRQGLGALLIEKVIEHARTTGQKKLVLWTEDGLADARRLYARCGFRVVEREADARFGPDFGLSETWELEL